MGLASSLGVIESWPVYLIDYGWSITCMRQMILYQSLPHLKKRAANATYSTEKHDLC
jgi:hypothetical protein